MLIARHLPLITAALLLACACQSPGALLRNGPMRQDGKPAGLGEPIWLPYDLGNSAKGSGAIDFGLPAVETVDSMRWLGASVTDAAALRTLAPPDPIRERVSDLTFVTAPPLRSLRTTWTDIGIWDDAYALADDDVFVLRRGDDLYMLPVQGKPIPARKCHLPGTANLRIVHGSTLGSRIWLFCHPDTGRSGTACAIDLRTGLKVDFDVPSMDASQALKPRITSWTVLPHTGGAIITVSGGQSKKWPLESPRPLTFWLDLRSGRLRQMPTGWDLLFFSADQTTAVFATDRLKPLGHRIPAAVSMRTGQDIPEVPDRARDHWSYYNGSNTGRLWNVVTPWIAGEGETGQLAGFSLDGSWYPFKLPGLDSRDYYVWSPDEREGRVAFRAVSTSHTPPNPMPCFTFPLKQSSACLELDSRTTDCALTGPQTGVFIASGFGYRADSEETFGFDVRTKRLWNLLDGIERLPALSAEDLKTPSVEDRISVRLLCGTGHPRNPRLVLCQYSHVQGDGRTDMGSPGERRVPLQGWHHSVLVGSGGRYETGLLQEGWPIYEKWLLNCGKLVLAKGETRTDASGTAHVRRFHVVDLGTASQPKTPK